MNLISLLTLFAFGRPSVREADAATAGPSPMAEGGVTPRSRMDTGGAAQVGASVRPGSGPVESRVYNGACRQHFGAETVDGGKSSYSEVARADGGLMARFGVSPVGSQSEANRESLLRIDYTLDSTTQLTVKDPAEAAMCCAAHRADCDTMITAALRGTGEFRVAVQQTAASRAAARPVASTSAEGEAQWRRVVSFGQPVDFAFLVGQAPLSAVGLTLGPDRGSCEAVSWDESVPGEQYRVGVSKGYSPHAEQEAVADALREARLAVLTELVGSDLVMNHRTTAQSAGRASLNPSYGEDSLREESAQGQLAGVRKVATCLSHSGGEFSLDAPMIVAKVLVKIDKASASR